MTMQATRPDKDTTIQRALEAIRILKRRVAELEGQKREAVAIVGMACRLPGGCNSPDELWSFLQAGGDAIVEMPREALGQRARSWAGSTANDSPRSYLGRLDGVDQFDADYFGIAPHEARRMDPQQRLALELSIEAIEDAGLKPRELQGTRTGVFMAAMGSEYAMLQLRDPERLTATSAGFVSLIANRVSFHLDLRGPSLAIESQCSSSLVALHHAVRALRLGECERALVGAVNVACSPDAMRMYEGMGALSPSGRCRTFDHRADGMVRGEGCVLLLLERVSSLSDGARVHAELVGSALGQDGRSQVFTAPNGPAQQAVVRAALEDAAVTPEQVTYVECHGTGTPLGDPIEVEALQSCYGEGEAPLYLGALKTHFGHLEAAAGLAGLLKVVLCMKHGRVPPNLHFNALNPEIDLAGSRLHPVRTPVVWDSAEGTRRVAAVSSFGAGGTNAHVLVAEAQVHRASPSSEGQAETPAESVARERLLLVTASTEQGLPEAQHRWRRWLDSAAGRATSMDDVCGSAATRRDLQLVRGAVLGHSHADISEALKLGLQPVRALGGPGPVLVFSGNGAKFWPMPTSLMEHQPVYADAMREFDEILRPLVGWSLIEAVHTGSVDLTPLKCRIPAAAAVQLALLRLLRHRGIQPSAVIGASMGEGTAAAACGALSEAEALRVAAVRGRLLSRCHGATLLALCTEDEARHTLRSLDLDADIAIVNSPKSVGIAGSKRSLDRLQSVLDEQGVRWFDVDLGGAAVHCRQVDAVMHDLQRELGEVTPSPQVGCPLISTSAPGRVNPTLDADYWLTNARRPVRFDAGMRRCLELGFRTFVEVAPHPMLGQSMKELAGDLSINVIRTLHRDHDPVVALDAAVAATLATGEVPLDRWIPAKSSNVSLPPRQWNHRSYWLDDPQIHAETGFDGESVRRRLSTATPRERRQVIMEVWVHVLSTSLGWPTSKLTPDVALGALGLESLAALEVALQVSKLLTVEIGAKRLLFGGSLSELVEACAEGLDAKHDDVVQSTPHTPPERQESFGHVATGKHPVSPRLVDLSPLEQAVHTLLAEPLDLSSDDLSAALSLTRSQCEVAATMLREELDLRLPPAALHDCPTPLHLLHAARKAWTSSRKPSPETQRWLVPLREASPERNANVVLFPHAGAGPRAYSAWRGVLPQEIGAWSVQLPGRETRLHERVPTSCIAVARAVVDALEARDLTTRPLLLFGHSLGSQLAFEVTREMRRRGLERPRALMVSASFPPDHPREARDVLDVDAEKFAREHGGLPPALLADPGLMRLVLPTLAGDLALAKNICWVPEPPLDTPLVSLAGTRDTVVPAHLVRRWETFTVGPRHHWDFEGDHFYLQKHRGQIAQGMLELLSRPT